MSPGTNPVEMRLRSFQQRDAAHTDDCSFLAAAVSNVGLLAIAQSIGVPNPRSLHTLERKLKWHQRRKKAVRAWHAAIRRCVVDGSTSIPRRPAT
jgi:hypothetical protein